jgi:hypothetical protein
MYTFSISGRMSGTHVFNIHVVSFMMFCLVSRVNDRPHQFHAGSSCRRRGWRAVWLAHGQGHFFPHLFLLFWLFESIQRMGGDSPSHKGRVHKRKAQTHYSSVANECSTADHAHQQSAHRRSLDALEPISSRHREINRV